MAQSFNLTARINLQGPYNLRPIVSKIKKDIGAIKPELKFKLDPAAAKSVKAVTAEIKKLDSAAKSAKKSVGGLNSSLQSLSASFNMAATSSRNAANASAAVTKATTNAAKAANQARTAMEEFGKQSGLAIKRFAAFSSVTTVIFGVTNAITDAYKEFLVFNKEIVRLSQVTNKSVSDLKGVSDEITRLSTTLGVTSSDLITVASTLAQAGLSAQDTKIALEALAKSALAPSFENITQTTEGAIAAIRQFGLQSSELESALGSINAVAAAFAVEAGDIIAAIQRTGGVFASASRGVSEGTDSLNEFIAIFTSVRQTTRESAETIATGLRTIFTRIQRSSTIELLKQYGVELRDLEGKFVGPYEAVRRLSEGLNKIDPRSADFARISEELGGFRQIGKVIPLIQQFAVAQDALNVAQRGSGSLTKDVETAQQSLAVQFEKTRQNFLALVREVGDSTSFKVFVSSTLVLTNALIDLGRTLKPLLPLLLTFTAIKAGSGLNQFLSGFGLAFGGRSGGGPTPGGGGAGPTGGGGGGGGNQPLTSALTLSSTATNALSQTITTLNTSVLSLNQNILNTNRLLLNRPPRGFASGGLVPGSGNSDTVSARLTPGEFVIRKRAVEAIGAENLAKMNSGGIVQKFQQGGISKKLQKKIVQSGAYEDYINQSMLDPYNLGLNSKIYNFGLVGLRSGTKSSSNRTENRKLESGRRVRINVGFLQSQNDPNFSKNIENDINNSLQKTILKTASSFGKSIKGNINPQIKQQILDGAVLSSAAGSVFESALQMIGAPYIDKIESLKSMDFPFGLGDSSRLFGDFPNNVPTDATRTIAGSGKGISDFVGQINRFFTAVDSGKFTEKLQPLPTTQALSARQMADALVATVKSDISKQSAINNILKEAGIPGILTKQKEKRTSDLASQLARNPETIDKLQAAGYGSLLRAAGGDISGKDTVAALLTPGEFVFSEPAAKRIGYGNLNRMNKVKGFNKGGVVGGPQRFAAGGSVISDPAAIVAAITGVLIPQIQRLSDTFSKLEGDAAAFGAGLGGAIREASSIVLSSTIGLRTVGASDRTVAAAQIGGGVAGAIGGALTDVTGKLLEKSLTEATKSFNKFDKNLQDIANAPTEELRQEATKRLQDSFNELDIAVRKAQPGVDNLENLNKIGTGIGNLTTTVLSTITAMAALSQASKSAALAVANSKLAIAGQAATSIGLGTKLLAGFGRFIPVIGGIITVASVAIEAFGFFNSKLKSTNEQFDNLNKALDATVKNSSDYNLGNKNFVENILPKFNKIVEQSRKQTNPQEFIRQRLAEDRFSNLDLRFRTRAIAPLAAANIPVGADQSLRDVADELQRSGADQLLAAFNKIILETEKIAQREDAVSYLIEKAGMTREQAESEYSRMLKDQQETLNSYSSSFAAAKNQEILSARSIVFAQNQVKVSLVNLDNILNKVTASYAKSLSSLTLSFNNINRQASILRGEPQVDMSGLMTRDIEIFKNLSASSNKEVADALTRFQNLSQFPTDIGEDLQRQIKASKVIQEQGSVLLNTIAGQGGAEKLAETVDKLLRPALEATVGTEAENKAAVSAVLSDVTASLEKALADGDAPRKLQEMAVSGNLLSEVFKSGEQNLQFIINSLETYGKFLSTISEEQKKLLELENQAKQTALQRIQIEKESSIKFKEIFDTEVPLSERLDVFDAQIRELTKGAGAGFANVPAISTRGTADISSIVATRQALRQEVQRLDLKGATGQLDAKEAQARLQAISQINSLNQAIDRVANSGEQVNLVFEAIARQRDQFKTQREVLIDILKRSRDPAQQLQLRREFESIQAVASGRFSEAQGFAALESNLLRIFSASQQETITNRILTGLGMGARPSTAQEASSINSVLIWLQSNGFTSALASSLAQARTQQTQAQAVERNDLQNEIDLRQKGIVDSFTKFKEEFDPAAILAVESVKNLASQIREAAFRDSGTVTGQEYKDLENIFSRLSSISATVTELVSPDANIGGARIRPFYEDRNIPLMNNNQLQTLKRESSRILSTGGSIDQVTQLIRQRIDEMGELNWSDAATQQFRPQIGDLLNKFFPEIESRLRARNQQVPQGGTGRAGATVPSASLNNDSLRAINGLATAITGDNTNITKLADAVNGLAPVIDTFRKAAESLANKIGPDGTITINQKAQSNVNISFDEALQVDVPLNNRGNNAIVDNIKSIIEEKISGLRREIGLA